MMKTIVLLNIFVESVTIFMILWLPKFKRTAFIWNINFCNIINVLSVNFVQFNASLLNKKVTYWPQTFEPLLCVFSLKVPKLSFLPALQ